MNSLVDGKYRITRALGGNAQGSSFEVEHAHLGTRLALKLLSDGIHEQEPARQAWLAQARSAAKIAHTNVATIHDVGVARERPYVVSELCIGRSLAKLLGTTTPRLEVSCEIGLQIVAALAAGHEHGVWHGNLTPESVIVRFDDEQRPHVKVLNLGLSTAALQNEAAPATEQNPGYVAPELLAGGAPSARSDLYSAAALMYELLSGETLIDQFGPSSRLQKALAGKWTPLAVANPSLPEPLVRAIEATLDVDPEGRLDSPQDLARHLIPYVTARLKLENIFATPTLDPVLRFSRRVVDRDATMSASLRLNKAPKPRRDPAVPQRMLMDPTFPRNARAPRLESLNADAFGKRRGANPSETEHLTLGRKPLLTGAGKGAAIAISFGCAAVLAWLSTVV